MNDITLKLKSSSGEIFETKECVSFKVEKELYLPYSTFSGIFFIDCDILHIADVEFFIDDRLIHKGFIDVIEKSEKDGVTLVSLSSRGYTAQLLQCELPEGIMSKPSLNSLLSNVTSPYITHENSSGTTNYIYLYPRSSIWEACKMLCLKMHNTYPFVREVNKVYHTFPKNTLVFEPKEIISKGTSLNLKSTVSNVYMRDLTDDIEEVDYSLRLCDNEIKNLGITREKYYSFDRAWAFDIYLGLQTKLDISAKAMRSDFVRYHGFNGEDINDEVIFDNKKGRINRIFVIGGKSGITTTLWRYYDHYNNSDT